MKKFTLPLIIITAIAVITAPETVLAGVNGNHKISFFDVPTLGEWGLIGTAAVLGAAGLYSILKRK